MSARNPGAPAVRNITNYHSYVRAVQSGEVEAVRQALERDPSYMQFEATSGPEKWSILWHPVVEGDLEMMTLLLDRGADVACRGARLNGVAEVYTLLQAACVTGRVETLRLLLARGADIGQELEPGAASWTAFSLAAANGHVECLRVLLDHAAALYAGPNQKNGLPLALGAALLRACSFNQYESVAFCLERGADVDVVDDRNCTPLMKAVQNNRPHVVRVLLASGCDVDREVNVYGPYSENLVTGGFQGTMTPLQFARRRPRQKEINSLFDTFLLARLVVAGRRSGHLAAVRRVFDSKDMTRAIARFLARKLRKQRPVQAIRVDELRAAGRLP